MSSKNKQCNICQKIKSLSEFHKYKRKTGDYYVYCRICYNEYAKNYRIKTGIVRTPRGTPKENLIDKKVGKLIVIKYNSVKK